jgi:hypothetical protein
MQQVISRGCNVAEYVAQYVEYFGVVGDPTVGVGCTDFFGQTESETGST